MAQYCFLEFDELSTARNVLETLNNQIIPGTNGVTNMQYEVATILHSAVKTFQAQLGKQEARVRVSYWLIKWLGHCCCCSLILE